MGNIINPTVNKIEEKWLRPWNVSQFTDLYNRDERFFAIVIKGALSFLNRNVLMYDKSIKHFILNTGSSYMYVESNGYEFSWNETSGEDMMYMELPRCVVEMSNFTVDTNELTQGFARGNYERKENDVIKGFNSEIKRIPIEISLNLHYVLSNFNECLILIQEIIDKLVFQNYFKINYLGNLIQCSIELPTDFAVQLNKIDLGAADTTQRMIDLPVKICTNYPIINENSTIPISQIVSRFSGYLDNGKRSDAVNITIDGKDMTDGDIFLDLRPYDFDDNGVLDESEIENLNNFIHDFDIDEDGEVTQHDISIIEEYFINGEYNIKFDILHIGTLSQDNLKAIYTLFAKLDFNHDNTVSMYELNVLSYIINNLEIFDFDHNLIIDYKDLNNLIHFIQDNRNKTYNDLFKEFMEFYKTFIHIEEMLEEIKDILNNNFRDILIWLQQCSYKDSIEDEIFNKLYEWLKKLLLFLLYDLNKDGVIDDKDIDVFIDKISNYTEQKISYYANTSIIIHSADHTLSDESITDVVEMPNTYGVKTNE